MLKSSPKLNKYLAALPAGLNSHPEMKTKAASFTAFLEICDLEPLLEVLPAELRDLVKHPPLPSMWMSEVKSVAIFCAAADICFRDQEELEARRYAIAKKLLSGPLYQLMMKLLSAERALKLSSSLWGQFHQGSTMTPFALSEGRGLRFEFRFPAYSYPAHQLGPMGMALLASAHISGEANATIELMRAEKEFAEFHMPF